MKRMVLIAALLGLLLSPGASVADVYQERDKLVQTILSWFYSQTIYEQNPNYSLPTVVLVDHHVVIAVVYEKPVFTTDKAAVEAGFGDVGAAYWPPTNTIYLSKRFFRPDTAQGRGILAHELWHYIQYSQGVDKKVKVCNNELEYAAYYAQWRWLTDVEKQQVTFDKLHAVLASMCNLQR